MSLSIDRYKKDDIPFFRVEGGGFSCVLSSLGAGLVSYKIDGTEMLSTFLEEDWIKDSTYHGRIIGPTVGRRDKPVFLDGRAFPLIPNEGNVILHGGKSGVYSLLFF